MAGLANSESLTNIRGRHKTERTNQRRSTVGKNITIQVRRDNDVVGLRLAEELVHHRVNDLLLDTNGLELRLREGLAGSSAEQAVGLGEDVGLVGDCDEGALVDGWGASIADALAREGDLSGHDGDAVGGGLGDTLDCLCDEGSVWGSEGALVLDVEVLCVLADDDHVDWVGGRHDGLYGADVGVEVEALAEGDDGGGVALDGCGGGLDGAEEGAIALVLEDLDGLVGEGGTGLLEGLEAGFEVDKVEFKAEAGWEGLEESAAGRDDFLADAVTGDETWEGQLVGRYGGEWEGGGPYQF